MSQEARHYCRNPRCRSRLLAPVTNPREAFCTRGCHTQFHRHRCLVCERPMERATERQVLCGRRKCKSEFEALKAHEMLGRYHTSSAVISPTKNVDFIGSEQALKPDRPYRQVTGPRLSPTKFRLAYLPLDKVTTARVDRSNRNHGSEPTPILPRHSPVAATIAVADQGIVAAAGAQSDSVARPSATSDAIASFGPLKQINAGLLNVGYAEAGPTDGPAVILLPGWPYDIHSFVEVAPLLAAQGYRVIIPYLRGYGSTQFLSADTPRNGQQAAGSC
jgi:hypothetical protein